MDRNETLGRAMVSAPHPKYYPFTAGRREILSILKNPLAGEGGSSQSLDQTLGEAWVLFTRSIFDEEIQAALKSENPNEAFRRIWAENMHVSEAGDLWEHIESERNAADAAATVHKPDPKQRGGKPETSESKPTG